MKQSGASLFRVLPLTALVATLLLAGCERVAGGGGELWGRERDPTPTVLRSLTIPLETGFGSTLTADDAGRLRIGSGPELFVLDGDTGELLSRAVLEVGVPPRVLGYAAERWYLSAGDELLTVDDGGEVRMRRDGVGRGVVALDPAARHVYLATESGAVIGLHPRLLRPVWAWPRLGRAATALAVSPEADRLYVALAPAKGEDAARLLVRDVQTGRTLAERDVDAPVRALAVDEAGTLFALADPGGAAVLLALRSGPDGLRILWRLPVRDLGQGAPPRLRVAPNGRLAVFTPARGGSLLIVDGTDGEPLLRLDEAPADAAFDSDGALFLLLPGEIRIVQ